MQKLKMINTNPLSDSQESALIDDETYHAIESSFGGNLPMPENMSQELRDISQIKQDDDLDLDYALAASYLPTSRKSQEKEMYTCASKRLREADDDIDKYYSLPNDILTQHNDTFPGQLNFQYSFGDGGTGQDWLYSESLDKVFIKMEKILPLRFTWDPSMSGLYLRTAMVFKLEQYKSDPVKRCHNHMASTNPINQNMSLDRIKHVVHCVNHAATLYQETENFFSILTPLCTPEAGSQYVPMCYRFLCKNSCPSGMNRRPTELIFTLEDHRNVVLGRRKLLVRVCSCPKRDKQKEEVTSETTSMSKSAKMRKHNATPLTKKMSSSDTHVFKIDINIVGKENYLSVLKYAYDVMAGQAARSGQYEFFKPYMEDIMHKTP